MIFYFDKKRDKYSTLCCLKYYTPAPFIIMNILQMREHINYTGTLTTK